jgi:hypothetical protein
MDTRSFGYVRATKRISAARQMEDLAAAGVEVIEDVWEIVREHVRPGDTMMVTTLHLLAPDWDTLMQRFKEVAKYGGTVRTLDGGTIDPESAAALENVRQSWQDEKHCKDPAEMRRRGKMGGQPPKIPPKSPAEKMVLAYKAMGKTEADIVADLDKLHGVKVSEATVSRTWLRAQPKRRK